jgi:4-hydroxythreonine-4-phosphate dehydrogenase
MIPFKTIAFEKGVNFTAGLPIIRTSPAHGTAYDIAGKNLASPASFREAIYLAVDLYKNRNEYDHLTSSPLTSSAENETNNNFEQQNNSAAQ